MKILVGFKNPKTGEVKHVKCGFSWTLLLFSGLFGLPLFLRRLNIWGIVFLILWVVNLLVGPFGANNAGLVIILFFVFLGLQFWLGLRGNEMTAKNYLEHDWTIAEPNTEFTKLALRQWGISIPMSTASSEATVSHSNTQPVVANSRSNFLPIFATIIITAMCVIGLLMYLGRHIENTINNVSSLEKSPIGESVGKCLLEVKNVKYLDGACNVSKEANGGVMIGGSETQPIEYFAVVTASGKNAGEGFWNEEKGVGHAHTSLGEMVLKDACWENQIARICAWKLQNTSIAAASQPESQWTIRQEKDKLTDKVTTEAYKLFPTDNGHIEARTTCFNEKTPVFDSIKTVEGIKFEFNYFVSGDDDAKKPESSYEHERNPSNGLPFVTVSYRLDSGKVRMTTSSSKYKNQALLYAFTKESSDIPNMMMLMSGNMVSPVLTTGELAKAQILKLRLSLVGGQAADMEIHLSDLHDVFVSCADATKSERNTDVSSPSSQVNTVETVRNPDGSVYEGTDERMIREMKERSSHTAPSVQIAPSINCNSTRLTTVELIACSSPELMKTDAKLNGTYQQLLQSLDKASANSLKKSQKQWLASRSTECSVRLGDIDERESSRLLMCLQGLYDRRVSELQSRLQ